MGAIFKKLSQKLKEAFKNRTPIWTNSRSKSTIPKNGDGNGRKLSDYEWRKSDKRRAHPFSRCG